MNGENYKRYPRSVRLAIAAALDASKMSRFRLLLEPHRIAVIIGTAASAILEIEQNAAAAFDLKSFPVHGVSFVDTHTLSGSVAEALGSYGPTFTLTTGCTASIRCGIDGKTFT